MCGQRTTHWHFLVFLEVVVIREPTGLLQFRPTIPCAGRWAFPSDHCRSDRLDRDGTKETVKLTQVNARSFEGETDTAQAGAYAVHVSVRDRLGNELLASDNGAVMGWSREYDLRTEENGILAKLSEETGGKAAESTDGLLDFPDTSARKRRDLTWILALIAGLLFLFDVAQRRLDWLKEPEKKEEKPETEKELPKHEKKKTEKVKPEKPQEKAADVLWENLQKKKRL